MVDAAGVEFNRRLKILFAFVRGAAQNRANKGAHARLRFLPLVRQFAPRRTKSPLACPVLSRPVPSSEGAGGGACATAGGELSRLIHARKFFYKRATFVAPFRRPACTGRGLRKLFHAELRARASNGVPDRCRWPSVAPRANKLLTTQSGCANLRAEIIWHSISSSFLT